MENALSFALQEISALKGEVSALRLQASPAAQGKEASPPPPHLQPQSPSSPPTGTTTTCYCYYYYYYYYLLLLLPLLLLSLLLFIPPIILMLSLIDLLRRPCPQRAKRRPAWTRPPT
jgi:hypothetical protein